MHCTPTSSSAELQILLDSIFTKSDDRITIFNQEPLTESLMEKLACNCLEGTRAISKASRKAVWNICQFVGTPYTCCRPMVNCMLRDGISDMIIPIVDANWIPYELLCIILAAGKEMEVGPLIFSVDKTDPNHKNFICQILCAAVQQNWQAPVLFHDSEDDLGIETVNLDWKKMLYFNSYELPREPLESLLGKMLRQKYDSLTAADWQRLVNTPKENWVELKDAIYDIYCDIFEELDINETFPLVKRYVIPQWVKDDILESL